MCVCVLYVYIYINLSILSYKRVISCLAGGFNPIESSPNTNEHQKIVKPPPKYVYPYPVHIIFAWKTWYLSLRSLPKIMAQESMTLQNNMIVTPNFLGA